jgi:phenylalanine-4-hydroxylase
MSADGFNSGPPPGAAADWTIDQGWDGLYGGRAPGLDDLLYERQSSLLPGYACDAFLHGLDALDLHRGGIPDFAQDQRGSATA